MHSYPHNISDYTMHTLHLTDIEDLCYRRLLDIYYLHERPLQSDVKWIAKQIRFERKWKTIEGVLLQFFYLEDNLWHHKRADQEIDKYREIRRKRQDAGKKGGSRSQANAKQPEPEPEPEPINTFSSGKEPDDAPPPKKKYKFSDKDLDYASRMWTNISQAHPAAKKPNLEKWANTIRLMREQDKRTYQQIADIFKWAIQDTRFWQGVIQSPDGLRKHWVKIDAQRSRPVVQSIGKAQTVMTRAVQAAEDFINEE